MPTQTNRKTVITRKEKHIVEDNKNKTGNKDSVKLVAIEDVQNVVNQYQKETEDIRLRIAKSITDILCVGQHSLEARTKFREEILGNLDASKALTLYNKLIEFERRINSNAK